MKPPTVNGYDAFGVGPNPVTRAVIAASHVADAESPWPDADSPTEPLRIGMHRCPLHHCSVDFVTTHNRVERLLKNNGLWRDVSTALGKEGAAMGNGRSHYLNRSP
jgi:hypothetical protein